MSKEKNQGKLMLIVPVGGRPMTVAVRDVCETLRCTMLESAFDEAWDDGISITVFSNDEGKVDGSMLNRLIRRADGELIDVIFGDCLIAAIDRETGDTVDLPGEAVRFYRQKYRKANVDWERRPR